MRKKPQIKPHQHGQCETRLYNIWGNMKKRCLSVNNKHFKKYGARGIKLYKKWEDFIPFSIWALSSGYSDDLSIDRINNDGDYTPDNCRWTDSYVQSCNTRVLCSLNTSGYRGVSKSLKKWRASITIRGKFNHLGSFKYPYTAALAYDSYIIINNLPHTTNFSKAEG